MRVAGEFLLTDLSSLASKDEIEYLWANQTFREYGDRLTKENDIKKLTISITGLPTREEAEPDIKEQLIVEYYSR